MTPRSYFLELQQLALAPAFVATCDLTYQEINATRCYVSGLLLLKNGCRLFIAEYVIVTDAVERPKYRYHLQGADGALIARWDNAPHPAHKHEADGTVVACTAIELAGVLAAIPGHM
ncbi:DUF6516 family protein [Caldilinea sp.]|uniref:toxin-antitoxin system TumE family protein n=1 Tax=Caldilinea sp. TaxID=2293560 RepID=UPI002B970AC9|nr:hypothetical protein [Anaerolineales bacterium]HQY94421.1 DUF6516 family protein [Caldilinea sp.]